MLINVSKLTDPIYKVHSMSAANFFLKKNTQLLSPWHRLYLGVVVNPDGLIDSSDCPEGPAPSAQLTVQEQLMRGNKT